MNSTYKKQAFCNTNEHNELGKLGKHHVSTFVKAFYLLDSIVLSKERVKEEATILEKVVKNLTYGHMCRWLTRIVF